MNAGASVVVIAVGAIVRYAVTARVAGVSLQTVGLTMMLAGILALVLAIIHLAAADLPGAPGPADTRGPHGRR